MTEQEYLYWLVHIQGMGAVSILRLYEYFGSFREVWKAGKAELAACGILSPKRIGILLEGKNLLENRKKEYETIQKEGIGFVSFLDPGYPKRLLPIEDRPAALFVKGKLPEDEVPSVAIIGARSCTEYGKKTAEKFAEVLACEGVQIVSGLALGIDGAAHLGALNAGEPTFGVLGCGINICYPRENYELFRRMEECGGIITELVPGIRPAAINFPQRNRIISGLSDAVIIIEAKEKSGTLITTDYALEQGKEVFALPGRLTDPLSTGCNRLIQNGAALCLSPYDVLEFLGLKFEKKLTVHKNSEKRLAKRENMLYSFLDSRPRHLEEIMNNCGLSVSECMEGLIKLELMGLIHGTGNQYYCRKL